IIVFIPQVAILFLLLQILEDMGYMARVVYMFDNLMRRFGMNGRSLVALVSSGACAIPAIMATRTIPNWKERMITIMVAPLISCSARIPVYTVLIAFVAPPTKVWGIFNWQGIAFMVLYLLGIFMALVVGCVFKYILKSSEPSYLMIEMPRYHPPVFRNILQTVYEKVVAFVVGAGKIIIVISIILWALAGYGPSNDMQQAEQNATEYAIQHHWTEVEKSDYIAAQKLESSYAGRIGKFIEPAIAPLGFDWKIGIALITSFAAREVFVGTIATIYSIGSTDDEATIRSKMAAEVNPKTGKPTYNLAAAASLLIFYVFAMQCMSTLAVVRRETGSWKWAIIQFAYMGLLAYLFSFVVYVVLSPFT
ncbi:MAG: ferrous iron transporter B, partial [Saprospiraceae bacterium]|nr:ferrous iron transporter B [Saprospiraceae bacterium]